MFIVIVIIVIIIIVRVILVIVFFNNVSNSIKNNMYVDFSVCEKVFNFLLGVGPDGISIEFYKALFPPDDENSVNNSASGLNCLQKIYSRIWNGEFPSSWNEASIISIPKKGDDLSDCDNYRDISLINNGIKLISKIVSKRISEYGLKNNFIRPEQFGFRTKEECVSLFISIREICQRRKNDNKETYLAFLDLKKAYDSVPIG